MSMAFANGSPAPFFLGIALAGAEPEGTGTLVHEICHAIIPDNIRHRSKWQARMMRAADQAESFGDLGLADWLREEVALYRAPDMEIATARAIYSRIQDIVGDSESVPSLKAIVKKLAQDNLMTQQKFKKVYRRVSEVYAKAVRERSRRIGSKEGVHPPRGQ